MKHLILASMVLVTGCMSSTSESCTYDECEAQAHQIDTSVPSGVIADSPSSDPESASDDGLELADVMDDIEPATGGSTSEDTHATGGTSTGGTDSAGGAGTGGMDATGGSSPVEETRWEKEVSCTNTQYCNDPKRSGTSCVWACDGAYKSDCPGGFTLYKFTLYEIKPTELPTHYEAWEDDWYVKGACEEAPVD